REEAKRQLLRAGGSRVSPDEMPRQRTVQVSMVRKPLFGTPKPKLSVIASCWSPLDRLGTGSVEPISALAGDEVVEELLSRARVRSRPGVYHYFGICSTTGWERELLELIPAGPNYSIALISVNPPGWEIDAPDEWPPALVHC